MKQTKNSPLPRQCDKVFFGRCPTLKNFKWKTTTYHPRGGKKNTRTRGIYHRSFKIVNCNKWDKWILIRSYLQYWETCISYEMKKNNILWCFNKVKYDIKPTSHFHMILCFWPFYCLTCNAWWYQMTRNIWLRPLMTTKQKMYKEALSISSATWEEKPSHLSTILR